MPWNLTALAIAAGLSALAVGLPVGLYALLTRGQRRTMRAIRAGAAERGWRYRRRRWQGNPTAFRIDGRTQGGLSWILTSGSTSGYDRGWSVRLDVRFPALGGETDLAVVPRGKEGRDSARSAAGAIGFRRSPVELASGCPTFDAAYQVFVLPGRTKQAPVDGALAERILHWPTAATAAHSVLAWRDSFGLQLQARLPGPPNWDAVPYFLAVAEDFVARVSPPVTPAAPAGFVERVVARLMRS